MRWPRSLDSHGPVDFENVDESEVQSLSVCSCIIQLGSCFANTAKRKQVDADAVSWACSH